MTRVKICGISRLEDGLVALEAGADFLGFVFYPPSHRYLEPAAAAALISQLRGERPAGWQAVAVVVNIPLEEMNDILERCAFDLVQVCGEETEAYCRGLARPAIKALRLSGSESYSPELFDPEAYGAARILVDTHRPGMYGGTGETSDWNALAPYLGQAFLAGGLDPENVSEAVQRARPWAVDVSSGVERDKRKDHALIRRFIGAVHAQDGVATR